MNRLSLSLIATLLFLTLTLTSCDAIAGIFKAGMWTAVIGILIVVFIILYFVNRSKK